MQLAENTILPSRGILVSDLCDTNYPFLGTCVYLALLANGLLKAICRVAIANHRSGTAIDDGSG